MRASLAGRIEPALSTGACQNAPVDRRNFLIGGIAASAVVRTWPFRVYSFPSQIITIDYAAEKEKYIRLARTYIDEQVAKYGLLIDFSFTSPKGPHVASIRGIRHEAPQLPLRLDGCAFGCEGPISSILCS